MSKSVLDWMHQQKKVLTSQKMIPIKSNEDVLIHILRELDGKK